MKVIQHLTTPLRLRNAERCLLDELAEATWRVPGRYDPELLLPGVSTAFLMHVTGRCYTTIKRWQAEVQLLQPQNGILELMGSQSAADGMLMSTLRGSCQMPFWSRIAAIEYRKRGYTASQIANAFQCSERAIYYITGRTIATQPARQLTQFQQNPPSRRDKNPV